MPYRDQPARSAPHAGRGGAAYRVACAVVRERARLGARCWFWRRPGHDACPGRINLQLPSNHRWAFTAHHLDRIMDGGAPVVSAHRMAPAHRACNSRDGLMAQNDRRARAQRQGQRTHQRGSRTVRMARGGGGAGGGQGADVQRTYDTRSQVTQSVTETSIDHDRYSRRW